eukprot:gene3993-4994_t
MSRFYKVGASMVSVENRDDVISTLKNALLSLSHSGSHSCDICKKSGIATKLNVDHLREHIFLFHPSESFISIANKIPKCPICNERQSKIGHHINECHGPAGQKSEKEMSLSTIYPFCLVIVRRKDGKFLLVNEVAEMGWWLPGGRVNIGETLGQCAVRETKEESGIDIEIKGVLRFEYSPHQTYSRLRVIFYGEPLNDAQIPKTIPDYESLGASYVSFNELSMLKLRGREPLLWFGYLEKGGAILPLSSLDFENAPL